MKPIALPLLPSPWSTWLRARCPGRCATPACGWAPRLLFYVAPFFALGWDRTPFHQRLNAHFVHEGHAVAHDGRQALSRPPAHAGPVVAARPGLGAGSGARRRRAVGARGTWRGAVDDFDESADDGHGAHPARLPDAHLAGRAEHRADRPPGGSADRDGRPRPPRPDCRLGAAPGVHGVQRLAAAAAVGLIPGPMARLLADVGRYGQATLVARAALVVAWQVAGWWIVVACLRRRAVGAARRSSPCRRAAGRGGAVGRSRSRCETGLAPLIVGGAAGAAADAAVRADRRRARAAPAYPTQAPADGAAAGVDGAELAEEGVGFGVPVLKRGLATVFPGAVTLTERPRRGLGGDGRLRHGPGGAPRHGRRAPPPVPAAVRRQERAGGAPPPRAGAARPAHRHLQRRCAAGLGDDLRGRRSTRTVTVTYTSVSVARAARRRDGRPLRPARRRQRGGAHERAGRAPLRPLPRHRRRRCCGATRSAPGTRSRRRAPAVCDSAHAAFSRRAGGRRALYRGRELSARAWPGAASATCCRPPRVVPLRPPRGQAGVTSVLLVYPFFRRRRIARAFASRPWASLTWPPRCAAPATTCGCWTAPSCAATRPGRGPSRRGPRWWASTPWPAWRTTAWRWPPALRGRCELLVAGGPLPTCEPQAFRGALRRRGARRGRGRPWWSWWRPTRRAPTSAPRRCRPARCGAGRHVRRRAAPSTGHGAAAGRPPRPFARDLDALPFPARDLLPNDGLHRRLPAQLRLRHHHRDEHARLPLRLRVLQQRGVRPLLPGALRRERGRRGRSRPSPWATTASRSPTTCSRWTAAACCHLRRDRAARPALRLGVPGPRRHLRRRHGGAHAAGRLLLASSSASSRAATGCWRSWTSSITVAQAAPGRAQRPTARACRWAPSSSCATPATATTAVLQTRCASPPRCRSTTPGLDAALPAARHGAAAPPRRPHRPRVAPAAAPAGEPRAPRRRRRSRPPRCAWPC